MHACFFGWFVNETVHARNVAMHIDKVNYLIAKLYFYKHVIMENVSKIPKCKKDTNLLNITLKENYNLPVIILYCRCDLEISSDVIYVNWLLTQLYFLINYK